MEPRHIGVAGVFAVSEGIYFQEYPDNMFNWRLILTFRHRKIGFKYDVVLYVPGDQKVVPLVDAFDDEHYVVLVKSITQVPMDHIMLVREQGANQ